VTGEVGGTVPGSSHLRSFVDRLPLAAWLVGLSDQSIRAANEALARLIGLPPAAVVGLRPVQIWIGDDSQRAEVALSALAAGAIDSYRARRRLHSRTGPVAVTEWVRTIQVAGESFAAVIAVPEFEPHRPLAAGWGPEAVDVVLDTMNSPAVAVGPDQSQGLPERSDADRIAALEHHLLQFAAELHATRWRDLHPLEVDASHLVALDGLPARQREVVDRLLRGERIPAIAASMFITPSTVRNHLTHTFAAFGVHSQAELLARLRLHAGPTPRQDETR
jgi:PAS domain S-box-containing protein